jgi:hypothetical protein
MGLSQISVNEFVIRKVLFFSLVFACANRSGPNARSVTIRPEIRLEKHLGTGFPSQLAGGIPRCIISVTIVYRKPADSGGFDAIFPRRFAAIASRKSHDIGKSPMH